MKNKFILMRKENPEELQQILKEEYWKKEKSVIKIAEEMEVSKGWVLKMMNLFKIPRRDMIDATKLRMAKEYPKPKRRGLLSNFLR